VQAFRAFDERLPAARCDSYNANRSPAVSQQWCDKIAARDIKLRAGNVIAGKSGR